MQSELFRPTLSDGQSDFERLIGILEEITCVRWRSQTEDYHETRLDTRGQIALVISICETTCASDNNDIRTRYLVCRIIRNRFWFLCRSRFHFILFANFLRLKFDPFLNQTMDLLSKQGLRTDGRRSDELRRIRCKMGVFNQPDGSAYLEQGNTKVVAAVYGPHEVRDFHLANIICKNDNNIALRRRLFIVISVCFINFGVTKRLKNGNVVFCRTSDKAKLIDICHRNAWIR